MPVEDVSTRPISCSPCHFAENQPTLARGSRRMLRRTLSMKGHTHRLAPRAVQFPDMRSTVRAALIALHLLLLALTAHAQDDAPTFLIESITVEGASAAAARIVIAESRIAEGATVDESELRAAAARIQRLPFIVSTDFRLTKGSAPGRYVLVVVIRPMSSFFLNASRSTTWYEQERRGATPFEDAGTYMEQFTTGELALGARTFVGRQGMLTAAAQRVEDRNDRFTIAYSQYDLFGTRASITAVVSYLDNPGARRSADPGARNDWHVRDNLTWELLGVLPLGRNDSLRASWQHAEAPVRYVEIVDDPPRLRPILRSLPQIRKELFWIHDTTNDPLFPTSGTRLTAGVIRTSTPTAGFTELGRVKTDEYRATLERSWSLTPKQALTAGASALDFDRVITQYRVFSRYSVDLWPREQTLRWGDLRLELEGDRVFTKIHEPPYDADSTLRLGLAYRGVWGVLRMNVAYNGWRQPEP